MFISSCSYWASFAWAEDAAWHTLTSEAIHDMPSAVDSTPSAASTEDSCMLAFVEHPSSAASSMLNPSFRLDCPYIHPVASSFKAATSASSAAPVASYSKLADWAGSSTTTAATTSLDLVADIAATTVAAELVAALATVAFASFEVTAVELVGSHIH